MYIKPQFVSYMCPCYLHGIHTNVLRWVQRVSCYVVVGW